jgi:tryptophan-rich sensory protein
VKNTIKLAVSVVGCELVGILGAPFTVSAIPSWYTSLNKPFFTPPGWLFAPVWTLLYFLMGVSFYLIWQLGWQKKSVRTAGTLFLIQLGLNFLWSPVFFGLRSPALGLLVILPLWAMIALTIKKFYPLSKWAAYLLILYLVWVSLASALNLAIWVLN